MTTTAFVNGPILTPSGLHDDVALIVENDRIAAIAPDAPADAVIHDLQGAMLVPGFIDVQVNGGGGRMFNDDPTVETIACIAEAHRRFGTTGLLPTVISDDLDVVEQALHAVDEAIAAGIPGVLGIHLEGPFLSPERKGVHREDKIRPLEDRHIALLASLKRGRTMVTVAPESVTPDQIRLLVKNGVRVSLGHSNCSYDMAKAALDAGASAFTHLFNAMSPLTGREPGMVGAAFAADTAYVGIIVDGQHLHPATVQSAFRAIGAQRMMLVSDAMSVVGTSADGFVFQGKAITRIADRLQDENGTLAGSVASMASTVRDTMIQAKASLSDAVAMASRVPAEFLGMLHVRGTLEPGKQADLAILDDARNVLGTWIGGRPHLSSK